MARTRVRWGRIGGLAGAAALSVALVAGVAGAGPSSSSGTYTVRGGDTVWSIASRLAGPHADPRPVVDQLISLNHLRDAVVQPGQRLAVPSR